MATPHISRPRRSAQAPVSTPERSSKYIEFSWPKDGPTFNVRIGIDALIAQGIPAELILEAVRLRHDRAAMEALLLGLDAGKRRS